ncbi:NAD-dependent epimerase/dehydratase family protein [Kineosporia sp. J2-2]|uniref:NAD-dependent epimerase/dehydratase family protein n=1 Tax=Kineosporia corallincola TaxID=2835133 RepID=A0ABS5TEY4_9ACTN|nr:NAD-dependent epimerase/dehydratase family protein [Kineosporia corallincola]MBT0769626.1 NAD-dependent epimerase/dehydratase family protein [Kineosporia corallincola]
MRIVVTGASGNLGSALLRRLRTLGHEVVGVSRRRPAGDPPWAELDLSDPACRERLSETFTGADAVVHLAWKLLPAHDEARLRLTNVIGADHVLTAAAAAQVPHLLVVSSVGAYSPGPKDRTVEEDWPTDGVGASVYARHKAAVERLLDRFEVDHPQTVLTRVRPGLVFQAAAAGEIARLFLGPLVPTGLIGRVRPPVVPLPAELVFQAVHADDVAGAISTLLNARAGGAFNVAADPPLHPSDLARSLGGRRTARLPLGVLRALAAATWRLRLQPTEPGWIDLAASVPLMSTRRLRELGWEPEHSSLDALGELLASMRARDGDPRFPPLHPGRTNVSR